MPPRMAVRDISLFERPVAFARPFRFGAVTITSAVQAFVRVEIEVEGRGTAVGASAELMASKWFDKRPQLSPEATVDELRRSLVIARELYLGRSGFETAFGLHASCLAAQVEACAREDIPPLAAGFGPAEIDKAIVDALLRCVGMNFFDGMAANVAGIDARLSPDLANDGHRPIPGAMHAGWNGSPFVIPSASTTRSKARAASPISMKMPARIISSSSSTAIRNMTRPA